MNISYYFLVARNKSMIVYPRVHLYGLDTTSIVATSYSIFALLVGYSLRVAVALPDMML